MKRILEFLALAVLAVLIPACTAEPAVTEPQPAPEPLPGVTFTGKVVTRGGGTVEGYPFRLYALEPAATQWNNLVINDARAYLNLSDGLITTSMQWPLGGDALHLVGVIKAGDGGDAGTASSTVEVTQGGIMKLMAGEGYNYDFLLSNNLTAQQDDLNKEMAFRHVMTQLVVVLNVAPGIVTECNVTGAIEAGKAAADYPVLTTDTGQTVAGAGSYNILYEATMQNAPSEPAESVVKVFHLIPDGSTIFKIRDVEVNGVAVGDITLYDSNNEEAGVVLRPGVSYTVTLTVNSRGMDTAQLSLGEWLVEERSFNAPVSIGRRMTVLWDAAGADVTAVEIVGTDNSVFAANVTKEEAGKGYVESASDIAMTIDKVYGYHGDVRVEMVSPKADAARLWTYTPAAGDAAAVLRLRRVLVATAAQLRAMDEGGASAGLAKHHYQVADIDLSAYTNWTPVSTTAGAFSGSYVGGGFKINNLSINTNDSYAGLFGCNYGGLISDVHVASGSFAGGYYSGVVCGYNYEGDVRNCTNEATVTLPAVYYVGGIVGMNIANVTGCVNRGRMSSANATYSYIGGIVGYNYAASGTVTDCTNYGEIDGMGNCVAGIVALNKGRVTKCTNRGKITGGRQLVAGIVGKSTETAAATTDCTNYGDITSTYRVDEADFVGRPENFHFSSFVGGICGENGVSYAMDKCENRGRITAQGNVAGGIAGYSTSNITNSSNRGAVTGMAYVGGICGNMVMSSHSTAYVTRSCTNYGSITATGDFYVPNTYGTPRCSNTGGIVGQMYNSDIADCNNYGEINAYDLSGGIAGRLLGNASNCHNHVPVKGRVYVGGVVGEVFYDGKRFTVSGCTNNAPVICTSDYNEGIGGIVGGAYAAVIRNCRNNAEISGNLFVGGIAGVAHWSPDGYAKELGLVENCTNTAHVTAVGKLEYFDDIPNGFTPRYTRGGRAGGIVGFSVSVIESCVNTSTANVKSGAQDAGGIVGLSQGTVVDSHNAATVSADSLYVGGIVGRQLTPPQSRYTYYNSQVGVMRSSNAGNVMAGEDRAGGIMGGGGAPVLSSYNTGNVAGRNYVGGICGEIESNFRPEIGEYNSVLACYNTGRVQGSGEAVGGICGVVQSLGTVRQAVEVRYRIMACYNTGTVNGNARVGAIAGELKGYNDRSGWPLNKNDLDIVVRNNYWAGNDALDAVGYVDAANTKSDVAANHQFSLVEWPAFNALLFWGEGGDPEAGRFWKTTGTPGTANYPKLSWQ